MSKSAQLTNYASGTPTASATVFFTTTEMSKLLNKVAVKKTRRLVVARTRKSPYWPVIKVWGYPKILDSNTFSKECVKVM